MATNRNRDSLVGLVRELRNLPHETEWVEFKVNHREPQTIGEYVSALSNAAAGSTRLSLKLSHTICRRRFSRFHPVLLVRSSLPTRPWLTWTERSVCEPATCMHASST